MSAGGLEGSGSSIAQGMHELLLLCAWSSSHWDVHSICMDLKPLGRAFLCMELKPLRRAFLCMELKPLRRAFSLHGPQATGTCLFSAWSSSHWDVPFLCMELEPLGCAFSPRPMQGELRSACPLQRASRCNLERRRQNYALPLT